MTLVVVPEDFVVRAGVQFRQAVVALHDLVDAAHASLGIVRPESLSLTLDLAAEYIGQHFGDALTTPARQLPHQLFRLRVLDVQGHKRAFILYSSYVSLFFLMQLE